MHDVPDGRSADDLRVIGMATGTGELVAVAQLLRDYPADGDWWIGLLLVAPSLRGRGVGSQLVEHVVQRVRAEGARSLHLAVSSRNPRAGKFWEGVGFVDTRQRRSVTAWSGHVDAVRILSQDLSGVHATA
jgi:GNAT superfamily N-acetyltransferase